MPEQILTMEKLAQALEKADAPDLMVLRARQGYYDDFKTPLAFPLLELMKDATEANLFDIVARAKEGEFDSTKEEGREWILSDEGKRIVDQLIKPKGDEK